MCTCFAIEERLQYGTGKARAYRRIGLIPITIYGLKKDTLHFNLPYNQILKYLNQNHFLEGKNFKLNLSDKKSFNVIVKEIQLHPVTDHVLHIDFMYV